MHRKMPASSSGPVYVGHIYVKIGIFSPKTICLYVSAQHEHIALDSACESLGYVFLTAKLFGHSKIVQKITDTGILTKTGATLFNLVTADSVTDTSCVCSFCIVLLNLSYSCLFLEKHGIVNIICENIKKSNYIICHGFIKYSLSIGTLGL